MMLLVLVLGLGARMLIHNHFLTSYIDDGNFGFYDVATGHNWTCGSMGKIIVMTRARMHVNEALDAGGVQCAPAAAPQPISSSSLSIYFNCEQLRAKRPGRGGLGRGGGGAGLIVMED